MKTSHLLFSSLIGTMLILSCVSAESELLRQARTIQDETLASFNILDSTMLAKITSINGERSIMAMDSTLSSDSLKLQNFMMLKTKIDNITNLESELVNWKSNLKLLPSAKDIDSGAENPFGENAKDQEILADIKKSQDAFTTLKIKAEAAMK